MLKDNFWVISFTPFPEYYLGFSPWCAAIWFLVWIISTMVLSASFKCCWERCSPQSTLLYIIVNNGNGMDGDVKFRFRSKQSTYSSGGVQEKSESGRISPPIPSPPFFFSYKLTHHNTTNQYERILQLTQSFISLMSLFWAKSWFPWEFCFLYYFNGPYLVGWDCFRVMTV